MKTTTLFLAGASAVSAYTVTEAQRFLLKNIDPIVVPGQYASHLHSFFGSDAVTLNTTTSKELQAGCSTAENPNDYSTYWVPTLVTRNDSGVTVVPISKFSAYYVSIENAEIAIPQDYKSLAGSSKATTQADVEELAGIEWFCEGDPGEEKDAAAFPSTTCSTHLQTLLLFHDCVNEDNLNSTYSGTQHWTDDFKPENRCPAGMKRMPQLRFSIRYDLRKVLPDGWDGPPPLELACGNSYCSHGDFINGWLPEAAENMLLANDKSEFAGVEGPAGAYNAGSVCGAENAEDADPENGTGDYEEAQRILDELAAGQVAEPAQTIESSSTAQSSTSTIPKTTLTTAISPVSTSAEAALAIVTSTAPESSSTAVSDPVPATQESTLTTAVKAASTTPETPSTTTCKGHRKGHGHLKRQAGGRF